MQDISPTGVRAVFEAPAEIFTVPAEKGDVRNLTNSSSSAERDPAWSPDGKRVAYFSDASGEYKLYLRDQDGLTGPKVIDLGEDATFYYSPKWSPDSKRILFSDKRLGLWPRECRQRQAGQGGRRPARRLRACGIQCELFARQQLDFVCAVAAEPGECGVFVLAGERQEHADYRWHEQCDQPGVRCPRQYASSLPPAPTSVPAIDEFGLRSLNRTTTASVYIAVLSKDEKSPIPPESDDEKDKADADKKPAPADDAKTDEKKDAAKESDEKKDKDKAKVDKPAAVTKIDLDGIQQRILALPIPARNYVALEPGKAGIILLGEGSPAANPTNDGGTLRSVWRFTLETRKVEDVLHNAGGITTSFNGETVLYRKVSRMVLSRRSPT